MTRAPYTSAVPPVGGIKSTEGQTFRGMGRRRAGPDRRAALAARPPPIWLAAAAVTAFLIATLDVSDTMTEHPCPHLSTLGEGR